MSDTSAIEWTDATWNPVTGCAKVSQGCKNCYALREWPRLSAPRPKPNVYTGRAFTDVQCHPERLEQPLRWAKPRRIFVNSMSDLFHEAVPDSFIDAVLTRMHQCPQHTFQVLTKRPERMLEYFRTAARERISYMDSKHVKLPPASSADGYAETIITPELQIALDKYRIDVTFPLANLWLGVSVEDRPTADERIPLLRQTPAAVHFISAEPLLGSLGDLTEFLDPPQFACTDCHHTMGCLPDNRRCPICGGGRLERSSGKLDWVIAGGESGPKARPSHPDWFRSLRDQCQAAGVPYFFKQWGEWAPADISPNELQPSPTDAVGWLNGGRPLRVIDKYGDFYCGGPAPKGLATIDKVGKRAAGRHLDGRTWDEYPR